MLARVQPSRVEKRKPAQSTKLDESTDKFSFVYLRAFVVKNFAAEGIEDRASAKLAPSL